MVSLGEYELPCAVNRILAFENKKLYTASQHEEFLLNEKGEKL